MRTLAGLTLGLLAGCSASTGGTPTAFVTPSTAAPTTAAPTTAAPTTAAPTTAPVTTPAVRSSPTATRAPAVAARPRGPVLVRYRLVRHTTDGATTGFGATAEATLSDARGWQRGDVRLLHDQGASYTVLLAEPDEAQQRCRPYDVYRKYSCQNGPLVVLNAERWRHATPEWTGTLAAYRQMLVNHEVGHLLGLHHPTNPQCPARGQRAPVMAQQSTELNGCLPNPWPLAHEVARLARHDLPLAPPPG